MLSHNLFAEAAVEMQQQLHDVVGGLDRALEQEAQAIVGKARRLSRVNTGHYRAQWRAEPTTHSGHTRYKKVVNDSEYAWFLEHGFRSHWVPGEWHGSVFRYDKSAKTGMYVGPKGGYVRGDYVLRRAVRGSDARLARRIQNLAR